jgi:hypothetical protein
MSESVGSVEFLFGVEEYLKYQNKDEQAKLIHSVASALQKDNSAIGFCKGFLQNLGSIVKDISQQDLVNFAFDFSKAIDSENFDTEAVKIYMATLDKKNPADKIFRGINNCIKVGTNISVINDAFSRSQMKSKFWLINELEKIQTDYDNVLVMAGWFGQLKSIYDKKCTYSKMRILEIDKTACETSDYVFNLSNLENYKVKSIHSNINELTLHKNGYEWKVENFKEATSYTEKFLPNLIINTSAEHMTEEWFHQIRFKEMESNPIVAIQSNNMFDGEGHVNCVHSVDHMKKKFPMKEILFEGELQLKGYKRVMLIGRP